MTKQEIRTSKVKYQKINGTCDWLGPGYIWKLRSFWQVTRRLINLCKNVSKKPWIGMVMKKFAALAAITFFFVLVFILRGFAQAPDIEWGKIIGEP